MSDIAFRLGPLVLDEFIAQGGMGRVWRAKSARGARVAVKVLRPDASDRRAATRAFGREIQAVARLRHPGIVPLYDFGEVSARDANASGGRVAEGSPYLVMELIDGPSLRSIPGKLSAQELRGVIVETLEGLAHSHARGIIHRDLKPSNILLAPRADGSSSIGQARLTDFGIAHAFEDRADALAQKWAQGTPGFMAPEQRANHWRDFGPWTDLFAVGRMVEDLLDRAGPAAEMIKVSLRPWLERMCAEEWSARFEFAADAANALGAIELDFLGGDSFVRARTAELVIKPPTVTTMVETSPAAPLHVEPKSSPSPSRKKAPSEPPDYEVKSEWRQLVPRETESPLPPWGLGVYGLRPGALIAREVERDSLWGALCKAADEQEPKIVLLRGPSGVGKSCLARWLCELAHESGAAQVLRTSFGERPDPYQGIGPMLARYFRTSGLPRSTILARLEPALRDIGLVDPTDWLVLTELVAEEEEGSTIRFGSERERNRALMRFFTRLSRRRPLIVWFDDLQWSRAAIALVSELQRSIESGETAGAIVLVATVRETEDEAETPVTREISAIATGPRTQLIDVDPLSAVEHKRLVRALLALEDSLATRVEELSDGNPLFAEQLLGDLISRDVLEPTGDGRFGLKRGEEIDLPAGLRALWAGRVQTVIANANDAHALELAAALGTEVSDDEWRALCSAAGINLDPDLIVRLFAARLAEPVSFGEENDRWRFVHTMLRESIEDSSRKHGRFLAAHELCADLLSKQAGAVARERTGRHLLAAGSVDRAEPLLLAAALRRHQRGEFRVAHFMLAERETALNGAGVAETDSRRLAGWLMLARCCRTEGELDEASQWAHRAAMVSQTHGIERTWCEALSVMASVSRLRGDTDAAHEAVSRARQLADRVGEPALIADCTSELAWIRQGRGDSAGAKAFFHKSLSILKNMPPEIADPMRASCLNGLAHGALQAGDTEAAMGWLEQALDVHKRFGSPTHRAYTLSALGDASRSVGRLDEAEAYHHEAYQLLAAVGYGHIAYLLMNLGLVELDRKRFDAAHSWFLSALDSLRNQGDDPSSALPHAMITPCCVARGEWREFDLHLEQARGRLEAGRLADIDVANPLCLAGELAAKAGETARARAALELALSQYREINRDDRAEEVGKQIASLDENN